MHKETLALHELKCLVFIAIRHSVVFYEEGNKELCYKGNKVLLVANLTIGRRPITSKSYEPGVHCLVFYTIQYKDNKWFINAGSSNLAPLGVFKFQSLFQLKITVNLMSWRRNIIIENNLQL